MDRLTKDETQEEMVARYRKELGEDLNEVYTGHCVLHGKFESSFAGFLNNPLGCNDCIRTNMIAWDRDINESLIWMAIRKLIADKKSTENNSEEVS
tara:strand:+ start:559 stop:846 length:288 start_codon:yes stop_codon:yes gene_type:complete